MASEATIEELVDGWLNGWDEETQAEIDPTSSEVEEEDEFSFIAEQGRETLYAYGCRPNGVVLGTRSNPDEEEIAFLSRNVERKATLRSHGHKYQDVDSIVEGEGKYDTEVPEFAISAEPVSATHETGESLEDTKEKALDNLKEKTEERELDVEVDYTLIVEADGVKAKIDPDSTYITLNEFGDTQIEFLKYLSDRLPSDHHWQAYFEDLDG